MRYGGLVLVSGGIFTIIKYVFRGVLGNVKTRREMRLTIDRDLMTNAGVEMWKCGCGGRE